MLGVSILTITISDHTLTVLCRVYLGTDDLVRYFREQERLKLLPTLVELKGIAEKLCHQYCTTQAYQRALEDPNELQRRKAPHIVPMGNQQLAHHMARKGSDTCQADTPRVSMSTRSNNDGDASGSDGEMEDEDEEVADQPECSDLSNGDWTLANSILMMRDGLLFIEVGDAIANGNTGRVWEVLKVMYFFLNQQCRN